MTLAQFSAANPDLANNWARANDPSNAADPNTQSILSFGSLDDYLRGAAEAYGVTITAGSGGGGGNTQTQGGGGGTQTHVPTQPAAVGYTADGFRVWQMQDEAGTTVEWWVDNAGQAQAVHAVRDVNGNALEASYINRRVTAVNPGGGGGGNSPTNTTPHATNWTPLILILGLGAGFWWWSNQRKS